MKVSANEIYTTVFKACVGAYVPRGVATEIANAVVALQMSSKNVLPELVSALEAQPADAGVPRWQKVGNDWHVDQISALAHGPSLIDYALLAAEQGSVVAAQVDYPMLIEGVAASNPQECRLDYQEGGLRLTFGGKLRSQSEQLPDDILVDPQHWVCLCILAEQILVPADDTNRADAGAGLTDND